MKKYEHRQLECVCEHECNVGEKYVLPQAQDFGLSWSMPMDQSGPLLCTKEDPRGATSWPALPDRIDKQTVDKGEEMAQAQALGIMFAPNMHKCHQAG